MPNRNVVVVDLAGRVVSWSRSAEQSYGYPVGEAIGRPLQTLVVPGEHEAPLLVTLRRVAGGTSVESLPALHRDRLGQRLTMLLSAFPIRDVSGRVERVLLVTEPTSEGTIMSREVTTGRSDDTPSPFSPPAVSPPDAETQVSPTEMAAVIAHELRNPLAAVRAAIQVLGRRLHGNADAHMVAEVTDRVDALDALLDDLLLFAETPRPQFSQVGLEALIQGVLDSLRGKFSAGFSLSTGSAMPPVRGDEELLKVVFQNLLVNAAQATPDRGTVVVTLHADALMVAISIADEGPGFSVEARRALFRPFFTTKARGTGLGLPVARRLIELHGGHLAIESGTEAGARVLVTLPIAA